MEKKSGPEIQFEAITSGLGFHPFSDGLPYAPVTKAPTPARPAATGNPSPNRVDRAETMRSGAGAVAAGTPTFVAPTPAPKPRISVPVAKPAVKKSTPAAPMLAMPEETLGFLYVAKRVSAFVLDLVLNVSILAAGMSVTLWKEEVKPELLMNPGIVMIGVLFFVVFHWALVTAQEIAFGTSVGKRIFGLALRGGLAATFIRAFFFLPSIGFFGVGLLWCLFDRKRRCWHDLVANLQPIEIASL